MEIEFMLTLFLVLTLSLIIGSFISAVSYRIPKGLGFVKGRSFCDFCKRELNWYDNIPLFSFLFYKGRSRCCNSKISIRYPLIEIVSLIGTMAIWFTFQNIYLVILFYITLTIFVIDTEYQIIPDNLNWIILILFLIGSSNNIFTGLFSGLMASLLLLTLNLITKGNGMGLGDVKLALGLGAWFSLFDSLNWLLVSFLTGGLVASILLIRGKAKLKSKIAFGPFLIVGFWIVKFFEFYK